MMLQVENIMDAESLFMENGILYITPLEKTKYSTIYLSESKSSWITIEWLSDELMAYATENYQELFNIHPKQRGKVVMHNNEECESPRWHRSYLFQPNRDANRERSYMYSGIEQYEDLALPIPFQPFLNFINEKEPTDKYNQLIVNWYKNGNDYIAPHSDCQKEMIPNAGIRIVTLCEKDEFPRELRITPKNFKNEINDHLYAHVKIKLKHGCIITMYGETQNKFKHGVPKAVDNHTSRISLTFRKF
jgi:alkylated DNA repair dioxygenase AlkB